MVPRALRAGTGVVVVVAEEPGLVVALTALGPGGCLDYLLLTSSPLINSQLYKSRDT